MPIRHCNYNNYYCKNQYSVICHIKYYGLNEWLPNEKNVIQMYTYKSRSFYTKHWVTMESMQYDTLEETTDAFAQLPIKAGHRIAEAYTVVRYRPVKV